VLDLNLRVSFCREICLLHGLCDVDRSTLLARLRAGPGSAVFLAVGGAAESLYTKRGCLDLVLKRRRGFVKVALEAGAELVPVIAFGENDQFNRVDLRPGSLMDWVQSTFKKLTGFAMPLQDALTGAGILNLPSGPFPLPVPLVTVVGAPIALPPFEGDLRSEAGRAHVDACHALYCAALQQLYDEHKDKYAPNRTRDMRFVE
jgi:2-acylglycerol O-acyltransferase 2